MQRMPSSIGVGRYFSVGGLQLSESGTYVQNFRGKQKTRGAPVPRAPLFPTPMSRGVSNHTRKV